MNKIKVLIVDDHALVRDGIRALLSLVADVEVVGEAANGKEGLEKVKELSPDVVLMDLAMPVMSGLEATRRIHKEFPRTRVLVITQYDDSEYIYRFLKAGAAGYVLKKAVGSDLVSAVRALAQGKSFVDPAIADKVIKGYLEHPEATGDETLYDRLSDREKTVFKLIAEGYTSRQIADTLYLSIKTVMTHRANIMEKLGLHNRAELIKYAIRRGLIQADS